MRPLIFSLIFWALLGTEAFANTPFIKKDYDKIIEKEFPISKNGTFAVTNKYGAVSISSWDKNAVSIKVHIVVKASSQSKADDVFDRISINFNNSSDFVEAETDISESKSYWFFSWSDNTDYQINYEVKMPASVHLRAENKYGNTYLPDLTNGAELNIKYGDVNAKNIKGNTSLDLGYGTMYFENIETFAAEIKYSKVKGNATGNAKLASKYSKIEIGSVADIQLDAKYDSYIFDEVRNLNYTGGYDNIAINRVENMIVETKYSDINARTVIGSIDVNQKYGRFEAGKVECNNAPINISSNYVEVVLGLSACNSYNVDISTEYVGMKLPDNLDREIINTDHKSTTLKSDSGNGGKKIKIAMKYGSLKWN